jgi:hypothetical protein
VLTLAQACKAIDFNNEFPIIFVSGLALQFIFNLVALNSQIDDFVGYRLVV